MNEQIDKKSSPIAILGMHRSGTSCLAGSLQEAGIYLGDVVTSAAHNQKGNRENVHSMMMCWAIVVGRGMSSPLPVNGRGNIKYNEIV